MGVLQNNKINTKGTKMKFLNKMLGEYETEIRQRHPDMPEQVVEFNMRAFEAGVISASMSIMGTLFAKAGKAEESYSFLTDLEDELKEFTGERPSEIFIREMQKQQKETTNDA
jgi:hypothetical protein